MKIYIWQNWFTDKFLDLLSFLNKVKIIEYTVCSKLIIVKRNKLNINLLAHELVHVDQILKLGFFKMMWQYLRESIKKGYANNKFEEEAYVKQYSAEYQKIARLLIIKLK